MGDSRREVRFIDLARELKRATADEWPCAIDITPGPNGTLAFTLRRLGQRLGGA